MDRNVMDAQGDLLNVLFSRMTWPSLMVRERACTSIAELLTKGDTSSRTLAFLKDWANAQQCESVVVFGLLCLLRAKMINQTFQIPQLSDILTLIKKPSVLSMLLIRELGYADFSESDWSGTYLSNKPVDFAPSEFFKKYCPCFLPPIYQQHAFDIGRRYNIPFYQQWAYEWKVLLNDMNKKPSPEPLYFAGQPDREHYEGSDFLLSEIYRSAYLRTLAWAIGKNNFSETDATYFALETCPIDPSLWKITSLCKPKWWPTITPSSNVIDTVLADIWLAIDNLWQDTITKQDKWSLVQATGRVYTNESVYDLEIKGMFQRCYGSKRPNLVKVLSGTEYNVPYVTSSIGLEGYIESKPVGEFAQEFDDWEVAPVACSVWPYTTPRWQARRLRRKIWIPAPFLMKASCEIKCVSEWLSVIEGENEIGRWQDWNWNLQEKTVANLIGSTGEYLLVDRSIINEFTQNQKCSFCWICRITQYYREHSYQEYKIQDYCNDYGTSTIIL